MDDMIIDCFAGGGGASVGIEMALGRHVDIAVNHDPQAIRMHKVNHPDTLHLTEDIFSVDLERYVDGRRVPLMWASPDCTSHSKAKGGQPRNSGLRILPWAVHKHAKVLNPEVIIMENVEEIQEWGPLNEYGFPIKERKGEEYKRFVGAMEDLGYNFDCRELVAADYGAPTTRKRWYAVLRKDGRDIVFPDQTHSKDGIEYDKWLECGDYIDWSDLGKSVFDRKKPLAEATQKRIALGIQKYIVNNPHPYMVRNNQVASFLIQYHGETREGDCRGQYLDEPIKTLDTSNRYGLVSAFLIKYYGTGCGQELSLPLGTITTKDRFGLVTVEINGETYRIKDIFLRMLKPEELKVLQGFPKDYIIDRDINWKPYPIKEQVARIGNSVVPVMAESLVRANCSYLRIGERTPNITFRNVNGQMEIAV
jgi:DNA (cytosine-5)-methyltransferase 1